MTGAPRSAAGAPADRQGPAPAPRCADSTRPAERILTFAAVSGREFDARIARAGSRHGRRQGRREPRARDRGSHRRGDQFDRALQLRPRPDPRDDLRAALAHASRAAASDDRSRRSRASPASEPTSPLSALAYHFSAAGDCTEGVPSTTRSPPPTPQRVYAVEPALAHYAAALEAAAELGLEPDRDPALRNLLLQRGRMRYRTGDHAGSAADFEAALGGARRSGDRVIEMEALNDLGIMQLRSNLGAAAASHEAALEIARELGDTAAQTNALDRLAVICSHLLEFDRALELGERALELARGTGDPVVAGRAMDSIKLAVWQLGDLARLEELTAELERLWRERGDLWYLQWTLLEGGLRADRQGALGRGGRAPRGRSRDQPPRPRPPRRGADARRPLLAAPQPRGLRRIAGGGQAGRGALRRSRLGGMGGRDTRLDAARPGGGRTGGRGARARAGRRRAGRRSRTRWCAASASSPGLASCSAITIKRGRSPPGPSICSSR